MKNPDLLKALKPVISVFNELSITYYIGGSVASSLYGIARTTMDVDIVADLETHHIEEMIKALKNEYYIDGKMINDALERSSSFNIIHLETMIKIDIFIPKADSYQQVLFKRKKQDILTHVKNEESFYFLSPEDIILSKLKWYNLGNRISERQWLDIIGVIKVQQYHLDQKYLQKWADELGLSELLEKAFQEADIGFHKSK